MENMEVQGIIEVLEFFDGMDKKEEVDAAVRLKDEITPYLIDILKKVLDEPLLYADKESDYEGHLYSVFLLSYFKEPKAHDLIIELFSLPGEMSYDLFGDITTEDLPALLYSTCGGSLERIKAMVLNKSVDQFCRAGALDAMVYAVVDGMVPREEVIDFFGSLFSLADKEKDDDLYTILARSVCDLYPGELMDKVEKAFEEKLFDPLWIGLDSFEEALAMGKENTLELTRKNMRERLPDDIHSRISWWAYPNQVECYPRQPHPSELKMTIPSKKKKKRKK